jgi:hypothetical protein
MIKKKNLGLNSMLNYNIKTENSKKYQFGNQLNYGSTLFYLKTVQLVQIGIAGEVYEHKQYGEKVINTAGDILLVSLVLK